MAEKHVGGRQAPDEPGGLALGVLVRTVAIAHASLEAGEAPRADLRPCQVEVLDPGADERVLGIVVAVHAQTRKVEPVQRGDPLRPQVAEGKDRVGVVPFNELNGVRGRLFVGEREETHGSASVAGLRAAG